MTKLRAIAATTAPCRRARLLWGASLAALIAASAQEARAQSVGALMAATHQIVQATSAITAPAASAPAPGTSAAMAAASARALQYQTQLNSAQSLAQQAQAAAQAAARALNQNQAARIVDGLTSACNPGQSACGLTPAVTQITPAGADPTGLATWQGANLPTATGNQVTVNQTAQRAVLSWTTFNVGQHTTLTFNQQGNASWVALNRVVGGVDPATGLLRSAQVSPSQILGTIKADGTVLVLNQNGILFGPTSQVNVGSFIATSLEIGRAANVDASHNPTYLTVAQRNSDFLNFGILGYSQQTPLGPDGQTVYATFSAQQSASGATSPGLSASSVTVEPGAQLTSADTGYLLLLAPSVVNAGVLSSTDGEVALESGTNALLTASTGAAGSADTGVRGLVVTSASGGGVDTPSGTVENASDAIIDAPRSYVSLGGGAVTDYGAILSSTSISANGYVNLFGAAITIGQDPNDAQAPAAVIGIGPDSSTATLPQDPTSLTNFQPSIVRIGRYTFNDPTAPFGATTAATSPADIVVGTGSLIYAPGANVSIGGNSDPTKQIPNVEGSLTVESGAIISAAGLTDVTVPALRNAIEISPVEGNELADSPAFRNSFLKGATVFLDPRLSGVSANGVAWVGSPLIAAAAYAQQVGEPVSELMVKGGNITLGVQVAASSPANAATFDLQKGAVIDVSGGWKTYQAGNVQQSYLIDASGAVVPISRANPDDTYVGLYNGYVVNQPRWGVTQTFRDPLLTGARYEGQYTEGQDAGSLTLTGPVLGFDASLYAGAFAGPQQILGAATGTATGSVPGDLRSLQAAPSQLPAGGYLDVDANGGGDIGIAGASYVGGGYAPQISASTSLSASTLSASGLAQLTVQTSGKVDVAADASLNLAPGGAFVATADRTVTMAGAVAIPSGVIDLTTIGGGTAGQTGPGSSLASEPNQVGAYDVVVDGQLNVAGRWVNDFNAPAGGLTGSAYLSGGSISIKTAANLTIADPDTPSLSDDISGSIVINPGAQLNLSGGGYVSPTGGFILTAKGGNLSLIDATSPTTNPAAGRSIFAINYLGTQYGGNTPYLTSRVSIADGSILDAGFGGGGTFSLTAPYFSFGNSSTVPGSCGAQAGTVCGAALPLDFFSATGFATYDIVSIGTRFLHSNLFDSGAGLNSEVLETQIAEVQGGQTLPLNETYFSPLLSLGQIAALQNLGTGGNLYSVLTPTIPTDAWDQKPVSLTLGGLIELRVDAGGQVLGAPGSALTVGELHNEGLVRIPGGTITQTETSFALNSVIGVSDLSQVFGAPLPDGTYDQTATNAFGATGNQGRVLTNAEVAVDSFNTPVYFLGDLPVGVAVDLAPGSVTDLSGEAIVNPRAAAKGGLTPVGFIDGSVTAGGAFVADGAPQGAFKGFVAEAGATLDLDGAEAMFDRPTTANALSGGNPTVSYAPTSIWSNGGALTLNQGGELAGATISAQGGAPLALGGILDVNAAELYAAGAAPPTVTAGGGATPLSVADIMGAGFSTFVSQTSLTSVGDATLSLSRAVFVVGAPPNAIQGGGAITIGSGGRLEIDAPYIGLDSAAQIAPPFSAGLVGSNTLNLKADAIDVTGGVLFDQSIGQATLSASSDIRLIGIAPNAPQSTATTLVGQLAANGDLTFASAQVYPTTGSTFTVETTGVSSPATSHGGTIAFQAVGPAPATPYSAGGSLSVLAADIEQGGVVRAPLGQLTLGSDADVRSASGAIVVPRTTVVNLKSGSVTSVSADGLDIPYGTTTDQVEWYFTPTQSAPLTAPPAGELQMAAGSITTASNATVDLSGGGDVYAYEFVSGTGGSRDVLDQFNSDQFSSNNGYQYPDRRQVYAIVPSLASTPVAALDPIYSSDYSSLYAPSQVGLREFLSAAPGLAAGWYTLLPAKYALLPGGLRVVQDTSATTTPPVGGATLSDGTIVTSGYFGVAGVNTRSASPSVFDVQTQATVLKESNLAQTRGDIYFSNLAVHNGVPTPPLPIDADRLILSPLIGLTLDASFETTPANLAASGGSPAISGRGAEVDISGSALVIDTSNPSTTTTNVIDITNASLADLHAASLFLGGVRTENTDGTTSLDITSNAITVQGGVTLEAPEVTLATDGPSASITIANGASLIASGSVTGESPKNYVIQGQTDPSGSPVQYAQGGFLRVSNGPERLVSRLNVISGAPPGAITVGAASQPGAGPILQGAAVELLTAGALGVSTSAQLEATDLALGSRQITFTTQSGQGSAGLILTPQLEAQLANTQSVTLQSARPIRFFGGVTYQFKNLTLDTPGLVAQAGGAVSLNASGTLSIADTSTALAACGATGPLACGAGSLAFTANAIAFGSGVVRTYGAGGGVTLAAATGVFADGVATFDAGGAPLTLDTPFLGDRGAGVAGAAQPSLTLATTGPVTIASAASAANATAPTGTPGSALVVDASSVAINGTELRATAGSLSIQSADGVTISGGALLATPSYVGTFGDSADPITVSAPGGVLSLTALSGDISISDDSRFAVGGAQGAAGTLSLIAQNGSVYAYHGAPSQPVSLASTFSTGSATGASLTLDTGGSFDLSAFAAGPGGGFTGDIAVRTQAGDLTLAAGDRIRAAAVSLTADGGEILLSGTIDTSGDNGGDVSLYGATGVELTSGSLIDAHANGVGHPATLQAYTATQQAHGGNVTLGVDQTGTPTADPSTGIVQATQSGAISIDTGAVIDVGATYAGAGARLVNMNRTGATDYTYVAGDVGGTVTFRAPVISVDGGQTVNVSVQGSVNGASSVVLDAFQRFDLATVAANTGRYVGVTASGETVTLDLSQTAAGKVNPLADLNAPLVQFIQTFGTAVSIPASLSSLANFHARPGVELDYTGNIVLASNWNLGAGIVNPADFGNPALFRPEIGIPGYSVVPGAEGQILADAIAIYRVGGSYYGEPGVLTLRAGGNLILDGSITDGFFQFADQTDPDYLNQILGGGNRVYQASLNPTVSGSAVTINFPATFPATSTTGAILATYVPPQAPYSAAANSPAALGDQVGGALLAGAGPTNQPVGYAGDPLGGAEIFPLLPTAAGGVTTAGSWSYQLVSGAALAAPGSTPGSTIFRPSADPLAVVAATPANVVVQDQNVYGYKAVAGTSAFTDSLNLLVTTAVGGAPTSVAAAQWLASVIAANPGLSSSSATTISLAGAPAAARATLLSWARAMFPPSAIRGNRITTTLSAAANFFTYVSANFSAISAAYHAPNSTNGGSTTWATAPTLLRSGTGGIEIAAPGSIDLRNGDQAVDPSTGRPSEAPLKLNATGRLVVATGAQLQLGGAAVYTAGAIAPLGETTATDVATGVAYTFSLGSPQMVNNLETPYHYGFRASGFAGILISDPVQTQSGGNITLAAGGDVLGRRDAFQESRLSAFGGASPGFSWIGGGDQPWRTGVVGTTVNLLVDPDLFAEGVGALGGGDITVRAGGDVSDISLVASDSIVTANLTTASAGPQAMANLSEGSISVIAGGDLLGGRLDVAAGNATVRVSGSVTSAGPVQEAIGPIDNTLQVRLADGTVAIDAGGSATVKSVGALGVSASATSLDSGANSKGFYEPGSGVTILAGGTVTVTNDSLESGPSAGGRAALSANAIVYPGSFEAVSFTAGLSLSNPGVIAPSVLLYPDPNGTLTLLATGNIAEPTLPDVTTVSLTTGNDIAQLDSDPTLLPGAFTTYALDVQNGVQGGLDFLFPTVLPNTTDVTLRALHNRQLTHAEDEVPNRIAAGGDLTNLTLSVAKQTRVAAVRDIIDMVFLGQNVSPTDITRVTAGRDITGATALDAISSANLPLPTVQGDTFILGGPGAFFIEAGRDAGPFLNSAVSGGLTYGGGVIAVGNQWNPWLPQQSADIYVEFGVANGENFAGLISTYLTPANFSSLPGYEFLQATNVLGVPTPIPTEEVYSLSLIDWMRSIAAGVIDRYDIAQQVTAAPANAPKLIQFMHTLQNGTTPTFTEALSYLPQLADQALPLIPWMQLHQPAALTKAFGTVDVTYAQALATFQSLPTLIQRQFLIKDVYFNELIQTSIPSSPSYHKYSRGYRAVDTLFPSSDGYTKNDLTGGSAGAATEVKTGNLDLRLATLQTDQGGNIAILGPGGEVLAGSVVATATQAARRNYVGPLLYAGGDTVDNYRQTASTIASIPPGYEGVLTLKGGAIDSFTDGDFLLNQSRSFTEEGGDIAIWSSNAGVNAGQGPRTTADVSPLVVHIDEDAFSQDFTAAAVSGAGIGAFAPDDAGLSPDVVLIAPVGTVDAGAAGVRSAGTIIVAAAHVVGQEGFTARSLVGVSAAVAVNVGAQSSGDAASAAAAQAAQAASASQAEPVQRPFIIVDVLGFLPDESTICTEDDKRKGSCE
jgi:filamentous hemagglutinin family protein